MPYTLKIDQPSTGAGEVYIHGLGTFANGEEHEITDEQELNFRVVNTVEVGAFDNDEKSDSFGTYVSKQELGPPLLEAAKTMYGVTVTDSSPPPSSSSFGAGDPITVGGEE